MSESTFQLNKCVFYFAIYVPQFSLSFNFKRRPQFYSADDKFRMADECRMKCLEEGLVVMGQWGSSSKFNTVDILFESFLLMVKPETWNSHMLSVIFVRDVDDVKWIWIWYYMVEMILRWIWMRVSVSEYSRATIQELVCRKFHNGSRQTRGWWISCLNKHGIYLIVVGFEPVVPRSWSELYNYAYYLSASCNST